MGQNPRDGYDFVREENYSVQQRNEIIVLRRQIAMLSLQEYNRTTPSENQRALPFSTSLQPRMSNSHMLQPPPPGIPIDQRPYPASPPPFFFRGLNRDHRMPLRSYRPPNRPFSDRRPHGRKLSLPPAWPPFRHKTHPFFQRLMRSRKLPPHLQHYMLPGPPSMTLPRSYYGRNYISANRPPAAHLQQYSMSPNLLLTIDNTLRSHRRRPRRRKNREHLQIAFNSSIEEVLEEQEDDEEEIRSVSEAYKDLHYYKNNDDDTDDDYNNDGCINNNCNALSNIGTMSF